MLVGMRVVSFCHYLQGPAAAQYLADMGADVVKIEPPGGAYERRWAGGNKAFVDGVSAFYLCANRNKRSICIDLKNAAGRTVVEKLIASADVVMENFRPGVMDRLGFGYARLRELKPDIIFASASGFGPDGPMQGRPGQDLLIQAYSGLMATGARKGDLVSAIGFAVADQHGAALLAMGILGAFVKKLQTGRGTRVDASLLNAGLDLQTEPLTLYYSGPTGRDAFERGSHVATWYHEAPYGIYRLADCCLALSLNDPGKLAQALRSEELARLAEVDRYVERDRYTEAVQRAVEGQGFAELEPGLAEHAVWYQRVLEYDDLPGDPQIRHNQVFREVAVGAGKAVLVNHPLRYDGEVPPLRHLAVAIGENGREVLAELGYAAFEIEALLAEGAVIAPPDQDPAPAPRETMI